MLREISDLEPFKDFAGFRDAATPYGYGGITVKGPPNGALLKRFFDEMNAFCRDNRIVSEYHRIDPVGGSVAWYDGQPYDCTDSSKVVCIRLESPEQILSDMTHNCRNRVRKARSSGVVFEAGYDERFMGIFRAIYERTMAHNHAKDYYYFNDAFFDSMLENLQGKAKIYLSVYNGLPVSVAFAIYSAGNAAFHFSGGIRDYMNLGTNNFLKYEAAKDLLNMGCRTILLGGGVGGAEDSLFFYKKSLNPKGVLDCHVAKHICDEKTYRELARIKDGLRGGAVSADFFPVYRA
jgi:hypothetical protein